MKKLSELPHVTDGDCHWLRQEISRLPPNVPLDLGECDLPPDCKPVRAAVSFYRQSGFYAMRLDREICYTGRNRAMRSLSDGFPLLFPDFSDMIQFFRELPAETPSPPARRVVTPPASYDISTIVNMDGLTVPPPAARAFPTREAIRSELEKMVMGQNLATETISHHVALHIKKDNSGKPLSFLFHGPPGTGKSEAAKALPGILSRLGPHQYFKVWTDLNTFSDSASVNRLTGASPGYIGYGETPIFEAITQNPRTVVIFDELDKAHPSVITQMMAVLDEGRCAATRELPDHSREYDFRRSIIIFTSNYQLGTPPGKPKKIGFSLPDDIADIRQNGGGIDVSYTGEKAEETPVSLTQRIYRDTESARKAFIEAGVLREIASRFTCFVEFKELSGEAKIKILAKQVIETALEYDCRLAHISSGILQALVNASASENALTVRSFKAVIEGYLSAAFAEAGTQFGGQPVRLEGTLESPAIIPA